MSSCGMCPYVLCILHSTRFLYKRRGFAVINIDIISYWVVKNMILRFRPCWAYPVGWSNCWVYPVWVVNLWRSSRGRRGPRRQYRNYRSGGPEMTN